MILKTEKEEIIDFLTDSSNYKGDCQAVYFPENENDVISILKEANQAGTPVTISGNGTGLTGARVPEKGIVISTSKLNKVVELNENEKYVIVEPGVILQDLQELVESKGLFYPPDPTERSCFVGATVANNSSGAKTFKYGPTRDYVLEIDVILSDGEKIRIKRGGIFADGLTFKVKTESGKELNFEIPDYKMPETKHTAGYFCKPGMDLIDLFIGSEGTLGFITSVKLKLTELAQNHLSCVIFFEDEKHSLDFIGVARDKSLENKNTSQTDDINALGIEFFDEKSLNYMREDFPQVPGSAKGAVWFEQEITAENEETVLGAWLELIEQCNGDMESAWIATSEADRNKFKDFRHAISSKVTEYITRENVRKVGTDTAVPSEAFVVYYYYMINLVKENEMNYICYGHAGNSHLHLNMLPKNEEQYKKARTVYRELCRKAVELGGTISAEHGIGKLKRDFMPLMFNDNDLSRMAKLKKALDPKLILCPGNMIDPKYFN